MKEVKKEQKGKNCKGEMREEREIQFNYRSNSKTKLDIPVKQPSMWENLTRQCKIPWKPKQKSRACMKISNRNEKTISKHF